eukprot:1125236-Rhodomonas_salina.2
MSLHSGGPLGFVEEREAGGETGVKGYGEAVDVPLGVLTLCSCLGLKVCLLIARVSCVGFNPHNQGLGSCASVKGVNGGEDEVWVDFVSHSGLSVAFLPSRDHGNDGHAISVDGEGDGGVSELES